MPSPLPSTRPRGGAPSGNTNALKHGFYARAFKPAEQSDLAGGRVAGQRVFMLLWVLWKVRSPRVPRRTAQPSTDQSSGETLDMS